MSPKVPKGMKIEAADITQTYPEHSDEWTPNQPTQKIEELEVVEDTTEESKSIPKRCFRNSCRNS